MGMPAPTIFEFFSMSDNIAVWYELDEILSKISDISEGIRVTVVTKFKKLVSNFDCKQDTQLLKYVFTAACLLLKDEESIALANGKL